MPVTIEKAPCGNCEREFDRVIMNGEPVETWCDDCLALSRKRFDQTKERRELHSIGLKQVVGRCRCGNHDAPAVQFTRTDGSSGLIVGLCTACEKRVEDEQAAAKAEQMKQLAKTRQEVAEQIWLAKCPEAYQDTNLNVLMAGHRLAVPLDPIKVDTILRWQYNPEGLFVYGPSGRGKTRLMWLLIRRLIAEGYHVEATDLRFQDRLGAAYLDDATRADRRVEQLCRADVLFMDEFGGKRTWSERFEQTISEIVDYRMSHRLPLLATDNNDSVDLQKKASSQKVVLTPLLSRLSKITKAITI